ncbi:MAG: cupin domain-containing protein [Hyphomicrobiaceae bacterium]
MSTMSKKELAFAPSPETPSYWMAGDRITVLMGGERTDGQYAAVVIYTVPGGGPPPHIHHDCSEMFYMLDGELTAVIDGKVHLLRAGACAHIPKGVVHSFENTGSVPARHLVVISPAGLEGFFKAAGVPSTYSDNTSPPVTQETIDRIRARAMEFQMELIAPDASAAS